MKRRLFNAGVLASLLILLSSLTFLCSGYGLIGVEFPNATVLRVWNKHGGFALDIYRYGEDRSPLADGYEVHYKPIRPGVFATRSEDVGDLSFSLDSFGSLSSGVGGSRWGFGFRWCRTSFPTGTSTVVGWDFAVGIPVWAVIVAASVLPVWGAIAHWKHGKEGVIICPACGYDLRGTTSGGTCPECGAATPARDPASPRA